LIVAKLGFDGTVRWMGTYGPHRPTQGGFWARSLLASDSSLFLVNFDDDESAQVLKIDPKGALLWNTEYSNPGTSIVSANPNMDGGLTLTGARQAWPYPFTAIRIGASAKVLWTNIYPLASPESTSLSTLDGGSLFVALPPQDDVGSSLSIVKTDALGNTGAVQQFPPPY